jgi:uncharacterized membrane protein
VAFLRNKHHKRDPLWHVQLVLLGVVVLQLLLPERLSALPKFVLPGLELLCLVVLQFVTPKEAVYESRLRRIIAFALIALVAVANATSLQLLLQVLFTTGTVDAPKLLVSGVSIYVTNIVIFALLYWEMDGGGPGVRRGNKRDENDFLFPQQQSNIPWHATFTDYLYVSTTNAMAFSPTDTMPLSRRAKMIMAVQAFLSLLVIAVIAARAINIL